MRKNVIIFIIMQLLAGSLVMGQDIFEGMEPPEILTPEERTLLAISNNDYTVTPGDVYQLTYQPTEEIITLLIQVEIDYSLNLGVLGKVAGEGLTFTAIKRRVEKKFSSAYPQSTPSLTIYSLGMFQVFISGEIPQAKHINAWGLSRLSDVLINNIGPYSSIRDIQIKNKKGGMKKYDLFNGIMKGEKNQNPYVNPGDTIIVLRRNKEIEVRGEVFRPGSYQILKNDTISDIIYTYGGDFTEKADTSRLRIERGFDNSLEVLSYNDVAKKRADTLLKDGDIIIIEPVFIPGQIIYIEGAVREITEEIGEVEAEVEVEQAEPDEVLLAAESQSFNLITHPFYSGDTLFDILNKIKDSFSPSADLKNSYIIKNANDEIIPINIQALLYNHDLSYNHIIENFDRIIIPHKSLFVSINGDVVNPGNYYYVPQKKYSFYIRLAGGISNGSFEYNRILILDKNGKQKDRKDDIAVGDEINVKQATVVVLGVVITPGEYPFYPGKLYSYYINLAGGIDHERNRNGHIIIKDKEHNKKNKSDPIMPEDTIYVPSNGISYNINRYLSIIATSLSIVISSFLIWDRFIAE